MRAVSLSRRYLARTDAIVPTHGGVTFAHVSMTARSIIPVRRMPQRSANDATIRLSATISAHRHIIFTRHGQATVLLDVKRSRYYSLNEIGGDVWSLLEQYHTVAAIVDQLAPNYDVPRERLERDVVTLLLDLYQSQLVAV